MNEDEPLLLGVGQRLQQHAVEHREDGSIRPDSERQRQRRHGGESRILPQHPSAETHVTRGVLQPSHAALVAIRFLHLIDAAEFAPGGVPRLLRRHAGGEVGLGLHLEMRAHLLGQIRLDLPTPEERLKLEEKLAEPGHERTVECGFRLELIGAASVAPGVGDWIYSLLTTRCSLLKNQVALSIALIVLDRSSHWVVSAWSCFRPAGVNT